MYGAGEKDQEDEYKIKMIKKKNRENLENVNFSDSNKNIYVKLACMRK